VLLFFSPPAKARRYLFPRSVKEKYVIAWLIAIDLYIIAFLRLPVESGYLIPIIPFVILLFGKYLYSTAFNFFAYSLILSSLFFGISPVGSGDAATPSKAALQMDTGDETLIVDPLKGPVLSYESRRKNSMFFTQQLIQSFDTLKVKTVLVTGKWHNQLKLEQKKISENLRLVHYLEQDSLLSYIGKGYMIYYLPKQDQLNLLVKNLDLTLYGADPYIREDIKESSN
jgi:hypothetical protein